MRRITLVLRCLIVGILLLVGAGSTAEAGKLLKLTVIGLDLGLIGLSTYAIIDQRSAASDYDELYNQLNLTTQANYEILRQEKDKLDDKSNFAAATTGLAALAVTYTIADMFYLHTVFGVNARIERRENGSMLRVAFARGF